MQTDQNRTSVLQFANQTKTGFLGSVDDGGKPRVRGVLLWFADENGFHFHTSRSKDLYRQLRDTPFAEVAFFRPDPPPSGTMLRVSGYVEFLEDPHLKRKLLAERPWLNAHIDRLPRNESSRDISSVPADGKRESKIDPESYLAIFRIVRAECRFWSSETNMSEQENPLIRFS